jgi:hypothetical protein
MANIQTIELREKMFDNVRKGIKIATLRNGKRDYILGDTILYGNEHKNAVFIEVTDINYMKLRDITDADAQQEGYAARDGLITVMKDIYKDITDESIVTQVYFRYISG